MRCITSWSNCPPNFNPILYVRFRKIWSKPKDLCRWQGRNRRFLQSGGCNSKINNLIWTVFEFIQNFIHVHLTCKFQEDPIKTEWVMLMIRSNKGFFNNQGNVSLSAIIRSGRVSNSSEIPSMPTYPANFRKIRSKLKDLCYVKVKQRPFFSAISGRNSKITELIWSGFEFIREFIHIPLICVSGRSDQNWRSYANDKVKQRLFSATRGLNSTTDSIRSDFECIRDFIHVPIIYKFKEDPIKTEWVMLITNSNRGFFIISQGGVTLRLMIRSGQFLKSSENLPIFTLTASFRKIWLKLSYADDKVKQRLSKQSKGRNSTINLASFQTCPGLYLCPS